MNLHQGNLLRRGFATLTQNLKRLQDGISDSGSEEQALTDPRLGHNLATALADSGALQPSL